MLCFLGLTIGADVFCIKDSARMMRESKARRSRSQAVASVICFLPGLSIRIIGVSGKRPYSDICPQGDSCSRIFFQLLRKLHPACTTWRKTIHTASTAHSSLLSWEISMDTAGKIALKLANLPSLELKF